MLADPFTLGSDSLPAISRGPNESVYMKADGSLKITIGHQYLPTKKRFLMKLTVSKTVADPFNSERNIPVEMSAHIVVNAPTVGFTNAEIALNTYKLLAQVISGDPNLVTKVVGGET